MYGRADAPDGSGPTPSRPPAPRHRDRRTLPTAAVLALTVAGLLSAFGAGAALLPDSLTGSGAVAETPAGTLGALAPGGGGAAAAGRTGEPAPLAATPSASTRTSPRVPARAPKRSASARPSTEPTERATTRKQAPRPKSSTPKAGTSSAGADQVSQENEVVRLVNVERKRAGCGAVRMDERLRTAIRLHVQELGTHDGLYLSHVSDDGRTFVQRAKAQGYPDPGGENVARGQRTAADVMTGWMDSDGHRANILNCSFKAIGVGRAKGVDGSLVWGQVFGRS